MQFGQVDPRRQAIRNLVVQLHKPRLAYPNQRYIHVRVREDIIEQQAPYVQYVYLWKRCASRLGAGTSGCIGRDAKFPFAVTFRIPLPPAGHTKRAVR